MKLFLNAFYLALGSGLIHAEEVETRAVSCDGCSAQLKTNVALNAVDSGTVYVFDANTATVEKFQISFDGTDASGTRSVKVAKALTVDSDVATAYRHYVESLRNLSEQGGGISVPLDSTIWSERGFGASMAIACDGCSDQQKIAAALDAVDTGTVYVFDANTATAQKLQVSVDSKDNVRRKTTKMTQALAVEAGIADAYRTYIESVRQATQSDPVSLPADFRIRSVAGALVDPSFTTTAIELYLDELSWPRQLGDNLTALITHLVRNNLLIRDPIAAHKSILLDVGFPDGSAMDYKLGYAINLLSGEAQPELESAGNARLVTGESAPDSAAEFKDMRFDDSDGALIEWIYWAQELGVEVVDGKETDNTSYMTCMEQQAGVTCHYFEQT